ncbi:MAG TPA: hypothetical protein VMT16_11300 [Thermoanaerobaculia bacterium]|nr:hypothetical protein [Thermoanaerobaculia bacterium]
MAPGAQRAAWPGSLFLLLLGLQTSAGAVCDTQSVLTLVGVDTAAGSSLFTLSGGADDGRRWLVEAPLASGAEATLWSDAGGWFGGSTGPGKILAARRCGPRCLQVVDWSAGSWVPVGEPLLASESTTFHATRDGSGAPWAALHSWGGAAGRVSIVAYRLEGGDWVSKGGAASEAVGSPALYPLPGSRDAVLSGTTRFGAEGRPARWVDALPDLPQVERGQVVAIAEGAAYFSPHGELYLRRTGAPWARVRWNPLAGGGEGDLAWRPGQEYRIELPEGVRGGTLDAVWVDLRLPHRPRLYLGRYAEARWGQLLAAPQGILTEGGERLPYNHLVRFAPDHWVLLTGCVATLGGSVLALRRFRGGELRDPELLDLVAGAR